MTQNKKKMQKVRGERLKIKCVVVYAPQHSNMYKNNIENVHFNENFNR